MGQLVRELKNAEDRTVIDNYVRQGYHAVGALLAEGKLPDRNESNDRQKATRYLRMMTG